MTRGVIAAMAPMSAQTVRQDEPNNREGKFIALYSWLDRAQHGNVSALP
jgi:hypothetical protein